MRFISVVSILVAGVAAQTSCAAQNILDACIASTTARVQACPQLDWTCMCDNQKAVLTCYDNCPADLGKSSANNQLIQWCNAASLVATTSTRAPTMTSAATAAAVTSSASTSSTSAKATGGAVAMYGSGSGLLAAAIGIAALV